VGDNYFPIVVNAYDTTHDVTSVSWRMGSANEPSGSGDLRRESAISWSGEHRHPHDHAPAKSFAFHVEAHDERGETWTASQQVETVRGDPARPAPGGDWPMF